MDSRQEGWAVKFTVYRDSWERGSGAFLYENETHCGCCLGHVANDMGVSACDLEGWSGFDMYSSVTPSWRKMASRNLGFNWRRASDINDDPDITDEEREAKLIELFAKHGHELTFVEGKRDWK